MRVFMWCLYAVAFAYCVFLLWVTFDLALNATRFPAAVVAVAAGLCLSALAIAARELWRSWPWRRPRLNRTSEEGEG